MKPAPFKYLAADSLAAAIAMKAEHTNEARFLAGGQSLIPAMNFRIAQPDILIDINSAAELDYLRPGEGGSVVVGALTRLSALQRSPLIAAHQPLVHEAVSHVAHEQIRNRATLCGNIANADPASELPVVLVALRARLRALSVRGQRTIDAAEFFRDIYTTSLAADELLAEIELPPLPVRTGTCFLEIARRRGDYAMMGVAAVVELDDDGRCVRSSLVYCNAGTIPMFAAQASNSLIGEPLNDAAFDNAARLARSEIDPPGTVHASREFQIHLAGVLTKRALAAAQQRARTAKWVNRTVVPDTE